MGSLEPGIHDGKSLPFVSATDYHSCTDRISRSQLWTLHSRSPAHLKAELDNPSPPTRAMLRGAALHTAILEPERFAASYCWLEDEIDRRTKDGKARWADFKAKAAADGKEILGWDEAEGKFYRSDVDVVLSMQAKLAREPLLRSVLSQGRGACEATYCWDEETAKLRCRFDRLNLTSNGWVSIDLKGVSDARHSAFQRSIVTYGLHFQAAMYSDGFEALRGEKLISWVYLAYETEPPYEFAFYVADNSILELGRELYRKALGDLLECQRSGVWPGFSARGLQSIGLPMWYVREHPNHE